jgi:hypothetical protein
MNRNQALEERARVRDRIDDQLRASSWVAQGVADLNPAAKRGIAVRECPSRTRIAIRGLHHVMPLMSADRQPLSSKVNLPPGTLYV